MSNVETIHLLNKTLSLQVFADAFKPGLDAVMLAAACPAKAGDSVLDLGCASGAAGLCVLRRVAGTSLTGLDIQNDFIALAQDNAKQNGFQARAQFYCTDIKNYQPQQSFDFVICNPPFLEAGTHLQSPNPKRAISLGHQDQETDIKIWIRAGFDHLKSGGTLTLIHRADHIDRIILGLGKKFGAIEIIPLWPKAGHDAKRVIVRAIKNRKTQAKLHPGIILHQDDGSYTAEANYILRQGYAI